MFMARRERYTADELKGRLIFIVGVGLTLSFVAALLTILYGLLFISQPITKQAPNDAAAWELLTPMVLFLTGALSGVLASNGLKGKQDNDK